MTAAMHMPVPRAHAPTHTIRPSDMPYRSMHLPYLPAIVILQVGAFRTVDGDWFHDADADTGYAEACTQRA